MVVDVESPEFENTTQNREIKAKMLDTYHGVPEGKDEITPRGHEWFDNNMRDVEELLGEDRKEEFLWFRRFLASIFKLDPEERPVAADLLDGLLEEWCTVSAMERSWSGPTLLEQRPHYRSYS